MKLRFALLLFIALAPLFARSQGCITIFSEDGDRFYLVLNGVKQNPMPQTNVRVDGLANDFYSAKILFEDPAKEAITKNMPTKDAATGQFMEMTFKIKKLKDGQMKLRYFGATPIPATYTAPPDMYFTHYGAPPPPENTVMQTTVTTTTTNSNPGNGTVNISIGGGGLNMNVNVNDPNVGSQTTSTSTYTNNSYDNGAGQPVTQERILEACPYPMDWNSYKAAKETIAQASFEETKLSTAKTVIASNCMSTDQIINICKLFSFEGSKLDFAKAAYSRATDKGNYFKVGEVFAFDASKTDLNNYIASHAR